VRSGWGVYRVAFALTAVAFAPVLGATIPETADHCIRRFLEQDDAQHPYRAARRLEAENGSRRAWLEAVTEYSPSSGFSYEVTGEGGSDLIRTKVLRAVLDDERDVISRGEGNRSSLARANYTFQPAGIDDEGLANVLLSPRRKERVLVSGRMFLQPDDGSLVRLRGQLAKNPSFWIRDVEIQRSYERISGVVVPVLLTANAQVRVFGPATLRMTYIYTAIDGHPISSAPSEGN
jgi:hypothetical protein